MADTSPHQPGSGASAELRGTGVERIAAAFAAACGEGRAALMPYMMGGFPGPGADLEIARAYRDSGADLVEVGVPFSDPLADGPVIHEAATRALAQGAGLDDSLAGVRELGDRAPAVLMCYVNMILALGPRRFAGRLAEAGAAGAIVPDLPLEASGEIGEALLDEGLALVPLLAPTTPEDRRRRICESAEGFVYLVAEVGVTGERDELPPALSGLAAAAREESEVPVAVGFGIGSPEKAARVGAIADGVIIGSRLVRLAGEADGDASPAQAVAEFLLATREALAR